MTGLFLLLVVAIWLFIANWLAKTITLKLPERWQHTLVRALIFVVLLPLPLVDEIIGGVQFKQLCEEHSVVQVDRIKAEGRTVYWVPFTAKTVKKISGLWVPVMEYPTRFVDAATGELLISYSEFRAEGGRLFPAEKMGTEPDYAVNEPGMRTSRLSVQALEGNNHERRRQDIGLRPHFLCAPISPFDPTIRVFSYYGNELFGVCSPAWRNNGRSPLCGSAMSLVWGGKRGIALCPMSFALGIRGGEMKTTVKRISRVLIMAPNSFIAMLTPFALEMSMNGIVGQDIGLRPHFFNQRGRLMLTPLALRCPF